MAKRGPGRPRKNPLPDPSSKGNLKVRADALKVKPVKSVRPSLSPTPPYLSLSLTLFTCPVYPSP